MRARTGAFSSTISYRFPGVKARPPARRSPPPAHRYCKEPMNCEIVIAKDESETALMSAFWVWFLGRHAMRVVSRIALFVAVVLSLGVPAYADHFTADCPLTLVASTPASSASNFQLSPHGVFRFGSQI